MAPPPPNAVPSKTRRLRNWLIAIAAGACILLLICFAVCWQLAVAAVAPTHTAIGDPPADLPCENVKFTSGWGATIAGWYAPADDARGVVVLLHPIRGSRRNMLERARLFHGAGYATLLIDLRGHGESTGDTVTMGHLEREDVQAAVDFARARHPGQPIAIDGWSLGGAAALLASPLDIDAMILEEVYPTIEEAVQNRTRMRVGPLAPLATAILLTQLEPRLGATVDELRPIDKLASLNCPILLLAGSDDLHTTAAQSQRMFEAARQPKECVFFDGAAHVDLLQFDPGRFRAVTLRFLNTYMRTPEQTTR